MNSSNNNSKGLVIGLLVVLAVVVGLAVYFGAHTSTQAPTPAPAADSQMVKGTDPVVTSQYFCVNNVCRWYYSVPFNAVTVSGISTAAGTGIATSTGGSVCSIPVPRVGSSTLEFASMKVQNAATSTFFFQIATSTSPSATTSPLGGFSSITSSGSTTPQLHWIPQITATSFGGFVGAQSGTTTFPTYVNFAYSSSAITPGTLNGTCQAQFVQDSH